VTTKDAVFWYVEPSGSVRTNVSEERIASIIVVSRIGELGVTVAVTSNRSTVRRNTNYIVSNSLILVTLMMEAIRSSETSLITRATRHNIPKDGILQLISY
jgi:hypothetical protein